MIETGVYINNNSYICLSVIENNTKNYRNMKKLLPAFALLIAPLAAFCQARLMINGTTPVYMVENGGIAAKPIYIEINNPAANAITTTGNNGWIVSEAEFNMVKWDMTPASSGAYMVPFGYSTSYYLPLTMNLTSIGTPPANGGVKFSTWHTNGDNGDNNTMASVYPDLVPSTVSNMHAMYNTPNALPNVTDDSYQVVDRFWVMDATGYSAAPVVPATGVIFSYIGGALAVAPSEVIAPNVFAQNTLLVQRFNPSGTWGDWLGTGGLQSSVGNIGTVNSGQITAANFFRSWTLSSSIDPLPIQISSFTTQCDNGTALIQWTVESQLNNAYFTIKKTTDGVHFETVATIPGDGTTSQTKYYSTIDNSPYAGTSYYFLYQTDIDNQTKYVDKTAFTGCGGENTTTVIAYNSTNTIDIKINSTDYDNVNVALTNMLGQTIINGSHPVALGENLIQLNNQLAAGIYILSVKNDKINFTKKLVIGVR